MVIGFATRWWGERWGQQLIGDTDQGWSLGYATLRSDLYTQSYPYRHKVFHRYSDNYIQ